MANEERERVRQYHVIIPKYWFRKKLVFTSQLSHYERQLHDKQQIRMEFNAGNMIYQMMRQLNEDEWEKQNALIYSYRNLVYKMSHVKVVWRKKDINLIHFLGNKNDVMWALSFVSQVFPGLPMECETVPENKKVMGIRFQIQNGQYAGSNATESLANNDEIPDVWSFDEVQQQAGYAAMPSVTYQYDPNLRPKEHEIFALPDGRVAEYISMDARFRLADQFKAQLNVMDRHNISASFMKDFEDMVRRQTLIDYNTYDLHYSAFMAKAHQLEHEFKGFDVTVYDTLPIAERGLPQAPMDTIQRTNLMDHDSLKYLIDKLERNKGAMTDSELKVTMVSVSKSTIARIRGYNIEYVMYQKTHTPEDLCRVMHNDKCVSLYRDFAKIDSYGELSFPQAVYRVLCNDPEQGDFNMTDVERSVKRAFGRGYAQFLKYQLSHGDASLGWMRIYQKAWERLQTRYLSKGRN